LTEDVGHAIPNVKMTDYLGADIRARVGENYINRAVGGIVEKEVVEK
jgi:hypothetical protein